MLAPLLNCTIYRDSSEYIVSPPLIQAIHLCTRMQDNSNG